MRAIAIEEHWTTSGIDRALRAQPAGIDVQILSIAPPGTHGLPAVEAAALSRDANDRASDAVGRYANAEVLYGLQQPSPGADDHAAAQLQEQS
jgi:hypothetical protein